MFITSASFLGLLLLPASVYLRQLFIRLCLHNQTETLGLTKNLNTEEKMALLSEKEILCGEKNGRNNSKPNYRYRIFFGMRPQYLDAASIVFHILIWHIGLVATILLACTGSKPVGDSI